MIQKMIKLSRIINFKSYVRFINTIRPNENKQNIQEDYQYKIKGWQIHSYGGLENVEFSHNIRPPFIQRPEEVLIEVYAASVNPIDIAMISGYGSEIFNTMKQMKKCSTSRIIEFPLILGRDFSGKVLAKGMSVKHINVGDMVWGVVSPTDQGCHAEQVLAHKDLVHPIPDLNYVEAASLLYAGLTAWSSLKISGGLLFSSSIDKKVLVLGGSGGVGSIAIQLLKAWGAKVYATCSTSAKPLVESLGLKYVLDYNDPGFKKRLKELDKFDIILDCAGIGSEGISDYTSRLKEWNCSKYITLKSPLLKNCDKYGLIPGMAKNLWDLSLHNLPILNNTSTIRWGYYTPSTMAIHELSNLVNHGLIQPCIESIYDFSCVSEAYSRVSKGHLRGKIMIDMKKENENEK